MGPHPDLYDECRVVRARGELDLTTTPALARELEAARHGTGPLFLIVDLRGATFMDSSVLVPFCAAWHDCRRRGGWMRVVHTRPGPEMVFGAVGLLERFPRYATVRDAWRDVRAGRAITARAT